MSEWISNDSLKDVLSFSATVSTVLQFLTGSLICREYFKLKSVGDTSSLPFTIGCLSCSLWLRYGTLINEPTVIFVNAVGVLLFLSYCTSYFIFTVKKRKILQQLCLVLLMISFAVGYSYIEYSDVESSRLIGVLCCSVSVFFFASPLIQLRHVIQTQNSSSLPFPIIISSFFVTAQWWIYGFIIDDSFIQIPNLIGCILSAIQLSLFVIYPRQTKYKPLATNDVINF